MCMMGEGSDRAEDGPARNLRGKLTIAFVVAVAMVSPLGAVFLCSGVVHLLRLSGQEAGFQLLCRNNMKQIALALHHYHDAFGAFPPAYVPDEDGRPMHSWRVLILPFLEQQAL